MNDRSFRIKFSLNLKNYIFLNNASSYYYSLNGTGRIRLPKNPPNMLVRFFIPIPIMLFF